MKSIVTNPEPDRFPEPVKHKSSLATIYRTRNRSAFRYEVRWHDDQGKRLRETFLHYDDAKAHALVIVKRVANGGADLLTLRGRERFIYERAVGVLRPHRLELDRVAHDHCQLLGLLDGHVTPLEAVRYYVNHRPENLPDVTVRQVVDELLKTRQGEECSKLYLRDLRLRLGRFAKKFQCAIRSVTPHDIDQFLNGLKKSKRYRFNWRGNIATLISFARDRGYLPKDYQGLFKVDWRKRKIPRKVVVFTPTEMEKLLLAAKPAVAVCLAITSFSGIRAEELKRLELRHINMEAGHIEVPALDAKNGTRRLAPITPNLLAWLRVLLPQISKPCEYANLSNPYLNAAALAGVGWKRNALRHGFVSYRVAAIQNIAQVALEAGHTVKELQTDYLHVVDQKAASAWFGIYPQLAALPKANDGTVPVAGSNEAVA